MTEPGLLRAGVLHAGRVLRGARRTPLLVVQSLMFPAVLLVMFELVLSRSLMAFAPGRDAGEVVALIVIIATVFGALVSGSGLFDEREAGLLARFTTVGSHPGSMLLGRVMAEVARVLCASVVLLAIGWAFGMSVHTGPLGVLAFFGVLAVIAATVGTAISTLAVTGATRSGLNLLAPVFLVLMFFNSGFAPIGSFPSVIAPVVRFLPFTVGVDTLLWCLRGGRVPAWTPLLLLGWCVVVVALSGWLWTTRASARISGERAG